MTNYKRMVDVIKHLPGALILFALLLTITFGSNDGWRKNLLIACVLVFATPIVRSRNSPAIEFSGAGGEKILQGNLTEKTGVISKITLYF